MRSWRTWQTKRNVSSYGESSFPSVVNLELYRIFYYTAKAGSISKAAQQLHMAQPSASLAVKQLEDSLQTNLFHRTPRGVSLTSEGRTLFAYIEQA
ncbi:LysR family transcriptional regulator [Paenibacillus sp. 1011MAR3C5]|nr:LysR family transcriptional regulator [Paenibacillus sp. 1011MAR3C5]